jgi:hypothetical protein
MTEKVFRLVFIYARLFGHSVRCSVSPRHRITASNLTNGGNPALSGKFRSLNFEVRGTQYEDRYRNISEMKVDDRLELERDYEDEFDSNAIKVQYKGKQIGFVERSVARILAGEIDLGAKVSTRVSQIERL